MFGVSFSSGEIFGLVLILVISLIPLIAVTTLFWRSFRRGWWPVLPGGLFALALPLIGLVVWGTGGMDSSEGPAFGIAVTIFLGGWVALGLALATLAVAGPKWPTLNVSDVF